MSGHTPDDCPECGQRKSYHHTTGGFCLSCGWVESLHTPGPWMVTHDPGSDIGARLLEPGIKELIFLSELDQDNPNTDFFESLVELHSANNDRLIEAVPELYALYLAVQRILRVDNGHDLPESVRWELGQALDRVDQTRLRYLDQNVKALMEGK